MSRQQQETCCLYGLILPRLKSRVVQSRSFRTSDRLQALSTTPYPRRERWFTSLLLQTSRGSCGWIEEERKVKSYKMK